MMCLPSHARTSWSYLILHVSNNICVTTLRLLSECLESTPIACWFAWTASASYRFSSDLHRSAPISTSYPERHSVFRSHVWNAAWVQNSCHAVFRTFGLDPVLSQVFVP